MENKINPRHIKDFLDERLNEGKRSSIVSQFKVFFNQYYSNMAVL